MPAKELRLAWAGLAAFLAFCASGPALADARTVALTPASAVVEFTSYALGLFPVTGHFTRFSGTLTVDLSESETCEVHLKVQVASLQMDDPARQRQALGPTMLDAGRFPDLDYQGSCSHGSAIGQLTLHGVTRQVSFRTNRLGERLAAKGAIKRRDFGIDGMRGLVGGTVTVGFNVMLPPDTRTASGP